MEAQNTFNGLEFVIDKSQSPFVKTAADRIAYLFRVVIEFKPPNAGLPKPWQWISVRGTAEDADKAKEYIIALTSPTEWMLVKNLRCNPLFTSEILDEIERNSCAALSNGEHNDLKIQGTDFSVTLAQSMIEAIFGKTNVDNTDIEIINEAFIRKDSGAVHGAANVDKDVSMKDSGRGGVSLNKNNSSLTSVMQLPSFASTDVTAQYNGSSHMSGLSQFSMETTEQTLKKRSLFPHEIIKNSMYASASAICPTEVTVPTEPHLYPGGASSINVNHKVTHAGDAVIRQSNEKPGEVGASSRLQSAKLSPQAKDQQAYLRHLGQSLHYSSEDIENALAHYSMDDVVRPREFLEMLSQIKAERHGARHDNTSTGVQEFPSSSHRPATMGSSSSAAASTTTTASMAGPTQSYNVPNRQLLGDSVNSVSNSVTKPKEGSSEISEQDYCDMDASVVYMGTGNDTIVLSSDEETEIPQETMLHYPAPPNHPPPIHNYQVPVVTNLHVTVSRREPAMGMERVVTVKKNSMFGKENYDSPQRQTGNWNLRYIIVDGSNVAMAHGNNKIYSVKGIEICIKYFIERGHDRITAFVPEWRRYSENKTSIQGRSLLEKLHNDGYIKFTPARRINGQVIASYDDRFMLNLAEKEDGVIVSNDQFRDLCKERASYQNIVEKRLLQFMFVEDHFMPPDDPLGRYGPNLDDFLRYSEQPTRGYNGNRRETWRDLPTTSNLDDWMIQDVRQPNQRQPAPNKFNRNNNQPEHINHQPERNDAITSALFVQLTQMFPEPAQAPRISQVLKDHKNETDLNRLSNYCINALFIK